MNEMQIRVTIVDQVPKIAYDVPSTLARSEYFDNTLDLRTARAEHAAQLEPFHAQLADLALRYSFTLVDLSDIYCDASFCNVQYQGKPLYRDSHHLSAWGSEQAADRLAALLLQPAAAASRTVIPDPMAAFRQASVASQAGKGLHQSSFNGFQTGTRILLGEYGMFEPLGCHAFG